MPRHEGGAGMMSLTFDPHLPAARACAKPNREPVLAVLPCHALSLICSIMVWPACYIVPVLSTTQPAILLSALFLHSCTAMQHCHHPHAASNLSNLTRAGQQRANLHLWYQHITATSMPFPTSTPAGATLPGAGHGPCRAAGTGGAGVAEAG
jgi:hypothetical protein